jgi:hypothetical protein
MTFAIYDRLPNSKSNLIRKGWRGYCACLPSNTKAGAKKVLPEGKPIMPTNNYAEGE